MSKMARLKYKAIFIVISVIISLPILAYFAVFGRALGQEEDHIGIVFALPKMISTSRVAQIGNNKYLSSDTDDFIKEMEGQGFLHIDQMGSAHIFVKNGRRYTSSSRMYSSYFMIFTYPEESRS